MAVRSKSFTTWNARIGRSGEAARFSEEHLMRYLFPTEVELLAQSCGMRVMKDRRIPHRPAALAIHMGRDCYLLQR